MRNSDINLPVFDVNGWSAIAEPGVLWDVLFDDPAKQMNPELYDEALAIVAECIKTGEPPVRGWT